MSQSLRDRIERAAAFDEAAFDEWYCNQGYVDCTQSAKYENARLSPLIKALGECASDLARWRDAWASQDTSDSGPARTVEAEVEKLTKGE